MENLISGWVQGDWRIPLSMWQNEHPGGKAAGLSLPNLPVMASQPPTGPDGT